MVGKGLLRMTNIKDRPLTMHCLMELWTGFGVLRCYEGKTSTEGLYLVIRVYASCVHSRGIKLQKRLDLAKSFMMDGYQHLPDMIISLWVEYVR